MIDALYFIILAVGGALCGIAGVVGESCALTYRAVLSAALQGALFGSFTAIIIDSCLGTQFSGLAVGIGGVIATLRMKLLIPVCNIVLKALYDVLFELIQRFISKE